MRHAVRLLPLLLLALAAPLAQAQNMGPGGSGPGDNQSGPGPGPGGPGGDQNGPGGQNPDGPGEDDNENDGDDEGGDCTMITMDGAEEDDGGMYYLDADNNVVGEDGTTEVGTVVSDEGDSAKIKIGSISYSVIGTKRGFKISAFTKKVKGSKNFPGEATPFIIKDGNDDNGVYVIDKHDRVMMATFVTKKKVFKMKKVGMAEQVDCESLGEEDDDSGELE